MLFYSTRNKSLRVSFQDAVLQGQPPDGGLYMPFEIPNLSIHHLDHAQRLSFSKLAIAASHQWLEDEEIPHNLIADALNFDAPLVKLEDGLYVLELFHGPTLAFKDFGARFLAALLSYYTRSNGSQLTILVATSGDTGSAVAAAFLGAPGIRVVLLYPSGKVSLLQEKQMTTMGQNVTALEVRGTFDDCQRMVKSAFADTDLATQLRLTSANSINIARLLPQSFYYFRAFAQTHDFQPVAFAVPSGNFGNLTAGVLAKKMGLPVSQFIAATNINDVVPEYLKTGTFRPRPSQHTISNAMDVGNPSNFARLLELYGDSHQEMSSEIIGSSHTDSETRSAIREVYDRYGYVLDPHGAVAYLAWRTTGSKPCILLETAHPAKFSEEVESVIGRTLEMPVRLQQCLIRTKQSVVIANTFDALKSFLLL
ncbi:MAG: threonine synthase [Acidobacteria bacterium]|nr:MAG: threonine synthase [Acidobacteriota bacterium]